MLVMFCGECVCVYVFSVNGKFDVSAFGEFNESGEKIVILVCFDEFI